MGVAWGSVGVIGGCDGDTCGSGGDTMTAGVFVDRMDAGCCFEIKKTIPKMHATKMKRMTPEMIHLLGDLEGGKPCFEDRMVAESTGWGEGSIRFIG